jgi:hypothetical protein
MLKTGVCENFVSGVFSSTAVAAAYVGDTESTLSRHQSVGVEKLKRLK